MVKVIKILLSTLVDVRSDSSACLHVVRGDLLSYLTSKYLHFPGGGDAWALLGKIGCSSLLI